MKSAQLGDRADGLYLQSFDVDLADLTARLEFGQPEHLSVEDMRNLLNGFRQRGYAENAVLRSSAGGGEEEVRKTRPAASRPSHRANGRPARSPRPPSPRAARGQARAHLSSLTPLVAARRLYFQVAAVVRLISMRPMCGPKIPSRSAS